MNFNDCNNYLPYNMLRTTMTSVFDLLAQIIVGVFSLLYASIQFSLVSLTSNRNSRLWTPLDHAADKGYADLISVLLEADAPIEAKDKSSVSCVCGQYVL